MDSPKYAEKYADKYAKTKYAGKYVSKIEGLRQFSKTQIPAIFQFDPAKYTSSK